MSRKEEIRSFVGKKIRSMQTGAATAGTKATLADLRRGVGREPGEMPQLFGTILYEMPEGFLSRDGTATKEEWVCYIALTLYALHQQGHEEGRQAMHTADKVSIGKAMYQLVLAYEGDSNAEQRVLQRLKTLITAVDMKELSHHLRGTVQLLKSKDIPLNYEILAEDLYELQFPEGKNRVSLRWGQDFYGGRNITEKQHEKEGAL